MTNKYSFLVGEQCINAFIGHGSVLILGFGEKFVYKVDGVSKQLERNKITLLIECPWRVFVGKKFFVGWSPVKANNKNLTEALIQNTVSKVFYSNITHDISLCFSLSDIRIDVFCDQKLSKTESNRNYCVSVFNDSFDE